MRDGRIHPTEVSLPQPVADAVTQRWPAGAAWVSRVSEEFVWICERFSIEPVRLLPARYSFVIEGVDTEGIPLVLRSSPDPHAHFQTAVVQALAELHVGPKIYEIVPTATGYWTVSERITPGISLFDTTVPQTKLAWILEVMRGHSPPLPNMPSLINWLHDRLNDDYLTDLPPGQAPASLQQRQQALAILNSLAQSSEMELCHGDASPGNILTSAHGPLLIDPRGIQGEVAYDIAVATMKIASSDRSTSAHLAHLAGVAPERVSAWMSVAEAARV